MLVIADSANNRIVIIDEQSMKCAAVVGNGKVGLVDGSFEEV